MRKPYQHRLQNMIAEIDRPRSTPRPSHSIPESNVLDLRKIVAEKIRVQPPAKEEPDLTSKNEEKSSEALVHPAKEEVVPAPKMSEDTALKPEDQPPQSKEEFFVFEGEETLHHSATKPDRRWNRMRSLLHTQAFKSEEVADQDPPTPPLPSTHRRFLRHRGVSVAVFASVGALVLAPLFGIAIIKNSAGIKGRVLGVSDAALDRMQSAGSLAAGSEWESAGEAFEDAVTQFQDAEQTLKSFDRVLQGAIAVFPGGKNVRSAEELLAAGREVATAGASLAEAVAALTQFDGELLKEEELNEPYGFTTALLLSNTHLRPTERSLARANEHLKAVSIAALPNEHRASVAAAQSLLPTVQFAVSQMVDLTDVMLVILGHEQKRRYLFLFQNDAELRATGGFVSSFALLDVQRGVITKLEIPGGGTYDLNGWMTEKVLSPEPLRLVNPHWNAQDANWWPDFPASAKKFMWFYEHSGGPSVDGVISMTPTVLEDLMKITGPIDFTAEWGESVSAENVRAIAEAQSAAQRDTSGGRPKQFIADFAPKLLNRLFAAREDQMFPLLATLTKHLMQKNMLMFMNNDEEQSKIDRFGWAGSIAPSSRDYLSVVHTNIAGGPTDRMIDQFLRYDVQAKEDGTLEAALTIERIHRGDPSDPEFGTKNMDYVRVYVPEGSILFSAEGFEQPGQGAFLNPDEGYGVDEDLDALESRPTIDGRSQTRIFTSFGKTVFANWLPVEAGTSATATLRYRLPFRLKVGGFWDRSDRYQLLIQKQAGAQPTAIDVSIRLPSNLDVLAFAPEGWKAEGGTLRIRPILDSDRRFGFVVKQK